MSKRHFYRQELLSLFQVRGNLKTCRNSVKNFSSSCFIEFASHVKLVWLHVVVFSEHILRFRDNAHLSKHPVKVPQNCLNYFSCSNQISMHVSKFLFALGSHP